MIQALRYLELSVGQELTSDILEGLNSLITNLPKALFEQTSYVPNDELRSSTAKETDNDEQKRNRCIR